MTKAKDLRRGDRFTYRGAFTIYRATSDAVVDESFPGRVLVDAVNEGWLVQREPIRIRLDSGAVVVVQLPEDADALCAWFSSRLTEAIERATRLRSPLRYNDEGFNLLSACFNETWEALPEELKQSMTQRAAAMAAEDWDAFAAAAIRPARPEDLNP